MNLKRTLRSMQENRDSWLEILNKNPDSLEAAQFIVTLNSQIQFIKTSRTLEGDYDE